MIHIFPTQKVHMDPRARRARLVVCTTDRDGNLHVMGLETYLRRGRRLQQGKGKLLTPRTSIRTRRLSSCVSLLTRTEVARV